MGDNYRNISRSNIVSRSVISGSLNDLIAPALQEINEVVAASKDEEVKEAFETFKSELTKPRPSKSALKALWESLLKVLPQAASIGEAVVKIGSIIS